MGFPNVKADTAVSELSGGEKARLLMGLATFAGPHLLILDEPTNHLDIDSRAALIEAINDYAGAVILVSHDRYLVEACADRLWLVADGTVKSFDGDIDDYRRFVLERQCGAGAKAQARAPASPLADGDAETRPGAAQARARRPRRQDEPLPGSARRVDQALAKRARPAATRSRCRTRGERADLERA